MTDWRENPSRGNGQHGNESGPRTLLVHTDQAGRDYTGKLLENLGNAVVSCSSYDEGIELVGTGRWDFVVVNQGGIMFPGRAILERVLEIDRRLPVLVLARYHEMSCYMDAMQLGAVDYLEEPVSPPDLARVVRTHLYGASRLERRRTRRRLEPGRLRAGPVQQGV